jgi:hypothetical protein
MRESKDTQYECVVGKIGWDRLCLPSDDEEDLPTLAKPLARSIPAVPPMRRKLSYHPISLAATQVHCTLMVEAPPNSHCWIGL